MTSPVAELVDQLEAVHAFELPCDYADEDACPKLAAKWVLWTGVCPACGHGPTAYLACDRCKTIRLESEDGVICGCGHVTVPARLAYMRCEAL